MKDNKIRTLPNSVPEVIVPNIPGAMFRRACDEDWTIQFISDPIEDITGYPAWEFINNSNRSLGGLIHPDDKEMVETAIHNALLAKRPYNITYRLLYRDGSIRWVNENGQGFSENGQLSYIDGVIVNITGQKVYQGITERKKTELYLNLLVDVLAILKDSIDFKDLAQRLLSAIKRTTGFDAVGMRLQAGEDYPYFLQEGFPNDFLLTENTLIERNPNDSLFLNPDGSVRLKCTCGLIISGKTDPSSPWFTRGGSFWTNNSAPLLALPGPDDPWRNPRNNCIHQGYASVALVPIRTKNRIVGLLQINDRRKGLFNLDEIHVLEGIAAHIGEALMRKEAEELLATERRRLSYILEGTNAGTWEWNIQTGELILNERWAEIIGYKLEELGTVSIDTWRKFIHPDDLIVADELIAKHFKKELAFYEHEMRLQHKNGSWIWALDRGKVVAWGSDGKPLIMSGAHQDITARKQAEEKIQHMANHDGLTDLPSLRLARDRLSMAMSLARRNKTMAAVMFLDLDGFKAVNDTFGHDAGDEVIKEVAKRLRSSVRETDTVARIGGDEFLLVITELKSTKKMAGIAEKVIRILSQPIFYKCVMATVGASIGIAIFPRDGADVDPLIKLADEAMYKVKASGKSGYKYANAKLGPKRPSRTFSK